MAFVQLLKNVVCYLLRLQGERNSVGNQEAGGSPRAQLSYSCESTRGRKLYMHVLCSTTDNRLMQDPPVQRAWCILTVEYQT